MVSVSALNITCFVVTSDLLISLDIQDFTNIDFKHREQNAGPGKDRKQHTVALCGASAFCAGPSRSPPIASLQWRLTDCSHLMELGSLPKRHLGTCSPPEVWCLYSWGRAYSHAWTSATTRINDFEQKQQLLHPSEHTLTCDELLQGGRVDKLQGISYSNQAPGECFGPDDPGGLFLPYWFYKCTHFGPVQRTLLHPRVPSARDMTLSAEGRA